MYGCNLLNSSDEDNSENAVVVVVVVVVETLISDDTVRPSLYPTQSTINFTLTVTRVR
jgi:hypothetical protein